MTGWIYREMTNFPANRCRENRTRKYDQYRETSIL